MKRIVLFTATGEFNLGDECIVANEVKYLRSRYPLARIDVATYDAASSLLDLEASHAQKDSHSQKSSPESSPAQRGNSHETSNAQLGLLDEARSVRYFSYFPNAFRAHPLRNFAAFFKNAYLIARADLVVVGGGGLFYDTEANQSFSKMKREWGIRFFFAQLFKKPVIFWSIGIDISHANLRSVSWWFTYKKAKVSVRDTFSAELLNGIGVTASLISDPVFLQEAPPKTPRKDKQPRAGLALRSGYLDREQYLVELVVRFLQAQGFEVIFLSHSLHPTNSVCNDLSAFQTLATDMRVSITQNMEETLALYPTLDVMISMRLHSAILCVVNTVPFYAISYGQKTRSILQSLELSFIQDASAFDFNRFKTQFEELWEAREDAEFAIRSKCGTIQAETLNHLEQLFYGF